MSAPATKAFSPAPVRTTAPTSGFVFAPWNASRSPSITSGLSALSFSGRLMVTVRIRPSSSVVTTLIAASAERVLVGRRPVDGGQRHVEEAHVDRELPAVVDGVVQDEVPDERDARHAEDLLAGKRERPVRHRLVVAHRGEDLLRLRKAIVQRLHEVG